MSASSSPTSDADTRAEVTEVLQRLSRFRDSGRRAYGKVYYVAGAYAVVAWLLGGGDFLILYLGVLAVIFMLHELSLRRVERQIDAVVETLQLLENSPKIRDSCVAEPSMRANRLQRR